MVQKFMPPSDVDLLDLETKRRWVRGHYVSNAEENYRTVEGKLTLLNTILLNNWIRPDETLKLQCLGIVFGDALEQSLGLEWQVVEDEYGRDAALVQHGTSIVIFPQTSISKRIEAGEAVNAFQLFKSACSMVKRIRDEIT